MHVASAALARVGATSGWELLDATKARCTPCGWRVELAFDDDSCVAFELYNSSDAIADGGWLCARLSEPDALGNADAADVLDTRPLRARAARHLHTLGGVVEGAVAAACGDDAAACADARAAELLDAATVAALQRDGLVVLDGWRLGAISDAADAPTALAHAHRRLLDGRVKRTAQRRALRGDDVAWLDDGSITALAADGAVPADVAALRSALALLRGVADALNRAGAHGARDDDDEGGGAACAAAATPRPPATVAAPLVGQSHAMASRYPADTGYRPHPDNPLRWAAASADAEVATTTEERCFRSNERCYTAILYANDPDWRADIDGGVLRVLLGSAGASTSCAAAMRTGGAAALAVAAAAWPAARTVNVAPLGGRLVVFDARLVHEVRPAARTRRAITQWIDRPEDGGEARGAAV